MGKPPRHCGRLRRPSVLAAGLAASAVAHGLLLTLVWAQTAPERPQAARRLVSLSLVSVPAVQAGSPEVQPKVTTAQLGPQADAPKRRKTAQAATRGTKLLPLRDTPPAALERAATQVASGVGERTVDPPQQPLPVTEPIRGVAFAPTAIGFGRASAAGWWRPAPRNSQPADVARPVPPPDDPPALALWLRELEQRIAQWPLPAAGQARCILATALEPAWHCEAGVLHELLEGLAVAPAELLQGLHAAGGHGRRLVIGIDDGRWRARLLPGHPS
jgi:hypothetical protein